MYASMTVKIVASKVLIIRIIDKNLLTTIQLLYT
jgi:hypothetical protein